MSIPDVIRMTITVCSVAAFWVITRKLQRPLQGYLILSAGILLVIIDLQTSVLLISKLFVNESFRVVQAAGVWCMFVTGLFLTTYGIRSIRSSGKSSLDSQYANLVENALVGAFVIQDDLFVFVNPRLAEWFGYDHRNELAGKPFLDLVALQDHQMLIQSVRKCISGEIKSMHFRFSAIRKDGIELRAELFGNVSVYENRPAIHGTIIDVSEQEAVVKALRTSEQRDKALARSTYDIINEINPDGTVVYVSDNIKDILGYDSEDMIGKSIFMLVHPDDYMTVYSEFDKVIHENASGRAIYRCRDKFDDWHWVESTAHQYTTASGELRAVIVSRDITVRRQMEDEIFKASKLESIGVLAGGIAHDFNNILTIILGNVSLAKSYADKKTPARQILDDAEDACLKAKDLTQQFLTFSKGGEPVKKLTSLSTILQDSVDFTLHGKKIRCEIIVKDELWPVDVDEGQISQVIHNLILNSEQAMPEGGIVNVTAENIILDSENGLPLEEGSYVKLSFKDHGVGISDGNLSKIFDPYFTTKQKGSGLGLTTAYSIVKNHGGLLTVESKLGIGTTFFIYLPAPLTRQPEEQPVQQPAETSDISVEQARILVMDDEDAIRKSVGRMLAHLGYQVVVSEDGSQALQLHRKARESGRPFDAVLMDLTVPGGMGGKEAIKQLRKIDTEIKAIVSSGYSNDPIMADFRNYGFDGVIAKPYQLHSLNRVIQEVITSDLQPMTDSMRMREMN
jgi:PAS domain S-box-containing protein